MCEECWDAQKDVLSRVLDNLKIIKNFQPHTTKVGKYLKEFVVHHALYDSIILLAVNIYQLFQVTSTDSSNARTANAALQFMLSSLYFSFAIFNNVHHGHHQIQYTHGDTEESSGTKLRKKIVDIGELFLLDMIFYARLMLTLFSFIEEHIQDDTSFLTLLNFSLTIKSKILYAYITPAVVIGEKAWSELIKGEKKMFQLSSFITVYGQKVIQVLLILMIGARYHTEYSNGYNREYKADVNQTFHYNFSPSGQLWYTMITGYLAPILGLIIFVILLLHIHNIDKNEKFDFDTRIGKLLFLLLVCPIYVISSVLYGTILMAFGLCTVINGAGGSWIALYVLTTLIAPVIHLLAPIAWVLLKPGEKESTDQGTTREEEEEARDDQGILLEEVAIDD